MFHTKNGSADTGTPKKSRRKTLDSSSTTSFRCNYMRHEEEEPDAGALVGLALLFLHFVAIMLKAAGHLHISWAVIMFPEILLFIGTALVVIQVCIHMIFEWSEKK